MAMPQRKGGDLFSQLVQGRTFDANDLFIAVMGVTGSGKSTFISRCTGQNVQIGHGLVSCTSEIGLYTIEYSGHRVNLIDTPGFDDTYKTDQDVLKEIAFWLNAAYMTNARLSGIIYLHPIDLKRLTGSIHKNLRMFKKLCGLQGLSSVVLATTMWGRLAHPSEGERRETELKDTPEFWGEMVSNGSQVFRHTDDHHSAMNIVSYILSQHRTTTLEIQQQMSIEGKSLEQTSAGIELEGELRKQREAFERRIQEAEEEMRLAIAENDQRAASEISEQQERFQKKLDQIQRSREELKVNFENPFKDKEKQYEHLLNSFEQEKKNNVDELARLRRQITAQEEKAEAERLQREKDQKAREETEAKRLQEMQAKLEEQELEAKKDREAREARDAAAAAKAEELQKQLAEQESKAKRDREEINDLRRQRSASIPQASYTPTFKSEYKKTLGKRAGDATAAAGGVAGGLLLLAACCIM